MRHKRWGAGSGGAAAVVVALVLSGCSNDGFAEDSTMFRLSEAGAVNIGVKYDQPLFGEMDTQGSPQGFDIEIARIIATELGIPEQEIRWKETPSSSRESALADGTVDLVVATYTISDERKASVGFAGPYYVAGQSLLTRTDDASISSTADLAGKQVCSVDGSTAAATIQALAPEASLVLFGDYSDCIGPLREGQVDTITTDNVILAGYAAQNPGEFRLVGGTFTSEPYGVGVAHGDDEFRLWIDDVLEAAMEDGRWLDAWEATAGQVLPEPQRPHIDRYGDE